MRTVAQEAIDLFNKDYRQVVRIHFANGSTAFDITESDIIQGGMTIDRYCVSGTKIEIGSAVAAELTLKLRNYDGKFDDTPFEGATLDVEVGIKKWDAQEWEKAQLYWIPCGQFTIDTPPRTLDTITVSALDRMVKFDKVLDTKDLALPAHIDALLVQMCAVCGVTLQTDVSVLPNHQFSVGTLDTSDGSQITYRQVLRWCAAMTGTCAYIDVDGSLVLGWYGQTDYTFGPSERYSSDMLENDVAITGFTCTDSDSKTYLAGTDDYTLDLSDCALLTNSQQGVLDQLAQARCGFRYRPYQATVKSAPYLFPLDMIHYVDKFGETHDTIVTNVNFTLNCNTAIAGSGETVTSSSYASTTPGMTDQQVTSNNHYHKKTEELDDKAKELERQTQELFDKADEAFKKADDLYAKADDLYKQLDSVDTDIDSITKDLVVIKQDVTDVSTDLTQTKEEISLKASKTEAVQYAKDAQSEAVIEANKHTDSQIKLMSDSIALKVSKDEAVKMVDDAKSEAISTAADDATQKASGAVTEANKHTDSQIKLMSDSIALKVSKDEAVKMVDDAKSEAISTAADDATQKASGAVTEANKHTDSQIKLMSDSIALKVSKDEAVKMVDDAKSEAVLEANQHTDSQIELTSKEISLKVSKTEAVEMVGAAKSEAVTSANQHTDAEIKAVSDKIELKVSKGDIAAAINMTSQSVLIQANKIDLKGQITADMLHAGTITADYLDTSCISKLIWSNAAASSQFCNQTLTVTVNDNVGFKSFMILFSGYCVNGNKYPTSCVFIPMSSTFSITHSMSMAYPNSEVYNNGTWYVDDYTRSNATRFVRVTNTFATNKSYQFTFSDAYYAPKDLYSNDDNYIIPLEIYGIR